MKPDNEELSEMDKATNVCLTTIKDLTSNSSYRII